MSLELKFDPKTIEHLGVKMYATLPPALAELISNAYDADSANVVVEFTEVNKVPKGIVVKDEGEGMSLDEEMKGTSHQRNSRGYLPGKRDLGN